MNTDAAKSLALELMEEHGLIAQGWRFRWNLSGSNFGECRYFRKLIIMSKLLTTILSEAEVRETMLHETAHALAPFDTADHGPNWQAMCRQIGARPEPCGPPEPEDYRDAW